MKIEIKEHEQNGFKVTMTHSGQKRRYGDTYREYIVESDKPEEEVKAYCTEHVRQCNLTNAEYMADERAGVKDFGDHFRSSYNFKKEADGAYFYQIIEPSTH